MSTSQELDRAQERADKTAADLRRTETELRVTRVSRNCSSCVVKIFRLHHCFVVNLFVQKSGYLVLTRKLKYEKQKKKKQN